MTEFSVETNQTEGGVVVEFSGELDISTAPSANDQLRGVEEERPAVLVIDLTKLTFLDSTGLRLLVEARERSLDSGRRFLVVPGPERVQRVFKITGLETRFDFVNDAADLGK